MSHHSASHYPFIAGYRITALLGRGGMATVYAAVEEALQREVAIKVVDLSTGGGGAGGGGAGDGGQDILRFENEAQALARLRHPHIVGLYGFGRTADGLPYYAMPLLEGGDLAAQPRPMPEDALLKLLDALLDALAHAHAAGIIHRDIKPENILFDADGRPQLADFGAALRSSASRLTATGLAIGSVGYMSPEQARGLAVDARSDLYALALVAHEYLTGRPAFDGADALAVAIAQLEGPPPTLPAGLRHWQRFFDRALAPDPAQRFADAAAMRTALGEIGTRLAAVARPTAATRPRLTSGRLRLLPALGAVLLLLGTAALALLWLGQTRFDPERVQALIAAGAWQPPAQPNVLELLLAAQDSRPAGWQAARQALLDAAAAPLHAALDADDLVALEAGWPRWQALMQALPAAGDGSADAADGSADAAAGSAEAPDTDTAAGLALQQRLAARLRLDLEEALRRYDRNFASTALRLYPLLSPMPSDSPQAQELEALAQQVRALPLEGERFNDPAGLPLVLLQRPGPQSPGLAIMAAPVDPPLYAEYLQQTGKTARSCSGEQAHQGCLSRQDARALASWLSQRSGRAYRLPSRDELLAHADRVQGAATGDSPLAWTDSCVTVTTVRQPNVAQRAWGGVKSVFGGRKAQPRVEQACAGYYAVALDPTSPTAQTAPTPGPRSAVLLLAELPPTEAAPAQP